MDASPDESCDQPTVGSGDGSRDNPCDQPIGSSWKENRQVFEMIIKEEPEDEYEMDTAAVHHASCDSAGDQSSHPSLRSGDRSCDQPSGSSWDGANTISEIVVVKMELEDDLDAVTIGDSVPEDRHHLVCTKLGKSFTDPVSFSSHMDSHKQSEISAAGNTLLVHNMEEYDHGDVLHQNNKSTNDSEVDIMNKETGKDLDLGNDRHNGDKRFTCDVCGKAFPKKGDFNRHILIHENYLNCDICSNSTNTQNYVCRHKSIQLRYICYICGEAFSLPRDREVHRKLVHCPDESFPCDQCGKTFSSLNSLATHKRVHDLANVTSEFACGECGKLFKSSGKLAYHQKIHINVKPFSCNICGKSFKRTIYLRNHMEWHEAGHSQTCNICGKFLSRPCLLEKHMLIHKEENLLTCDVCSESFCDLGDLCKHRQTHIGEKGHECDGCEQVCHVKYHKTSCRKMTSDIHESSSDDATGSQTAKPKSQETASDIDLKFCQGMKQDENCEQSFDCDICGLSYRHSSSLNRHKLCHTGEDTFQCDVCQIHFNKVSHLKRHKISCIKEIPGEKTFECDVCGMQFNKFSYLKHHKISCIKEIPVPLNVDITRHQSENTSVDEASVTAQQSLPVIHLNSHQSDNISVLHQSDNTSVDDASAQQCAPVIHSNSHQSDNTSVDEASAQQSAPVSHLNSQSDNTSIFHQSDKASAQQSSPGIHLTSDQNSTQNKSTEKTCEICGQTYKYLSGLKKHMRIHTEKRHFGCNVCGKQFEHSSRLKRHKISCIKERDSDIITVDITCDQIDDTEEKPFTCGVCGMHFNKSSHLEYHKLSCDKECNILPVSLSVEISCDETTSDDETCNPSTHLSRDPGKSDCPPDDHATGTDPILQNGGKYGSQNTFGCDECGTSFTQSSSLYRHVRAAHPVFKPFRCDACGERFSQLSLINEHKVSCSIKEDGSSPDHNSDQLTSMSSEKSFTCNVCGKAFGSRKGDFNRHVKRLHANENKFTCYVCKKQFYTKENLDSHKCSMPYVCYICGMSFSKLKDVTAHRKSVHSSENSFACEECGKTFSTSSFLTRHKISHTTQFACDVCGKRFRNPSVLKNHQRTIHHMTIDPVFITDSL